MEQVFLAAKIFGAINTLQQASAQSGLYKVQAEQAKLEASQKALQYEERANNTLRKLRETQSTLAASGYARGILGTEGSQATVAAANERLAGEEFTKDVSNARNALTFGEIQSNILKSAAKTSMTSGLLSAAAGVAEAGYGYYKLGSAPTGTKATTGSTDYWKGTA
jgi:hypothetical protein